MSVIFLHNTTYPTHLLGSYTFKSISKEADVEISKDQLNQIVGENAEKVADAIRWIASRADIELDQYQIHHINGVARVAINRSISALLNTCGEELRVVENNEKS